MSQNNLPNERDSVPSHATPSPALHSSIHISTDTPFSSQRTTSSYSHATTIPPVNRVGYSSQTPISQQIPAQNSPQTAIQVRRRAPSPPPYQNAQNSEYTLTYRTSSTYDSKDKPRRQQTKLGLINLSTGRIVTYIMFAFIITLILYMFLWIVFGTMFAKNLDYRPASHLEVELARVKEQLKRVSSEMSVLKSEGVPKSPDSGMRSEKDWQDVVARQGDVIKKVYAEKAELELRLKSALDNSKPVMDVPKVISEAKISAIVTGKVQTASKEEKNDHIAGNEVDISNEQHAELVNQEDLKSEQSEIAINPVVWDKEVSEKVIEPSGNKDYRKVTPVQVFKRLPSSSVWCEGDDKTNRICRFRNLCFHPKHDTWFITKTAASEIHNVPEDHFKEALLELGTVANHPYFGWNYNEINPFDPDFTNLPVRYETLPHFLFLRLHPRNIMHNLHDDVIPMYHHLKRWVGKGKLGQFSTPFDLDNHRMLMMDRFGRSDSSRPFDYLSNYPMRYLRDLRRDKNVVTCFRDAVAGNTKLTTWYQYGFKMPQGKIPGKDVNGLLVREAASWIVRRNGLPLTDVEKQLLDVPADSVPFESNSVSSKVNPKIPGSELDPEGTDLIVILSRKKNRLILNEKELAAHLTRAFGYETVFVRNEDQIFEEQIQLLRRARVVVGMHGSILVMGVFCKIGTVLVEMFPFAVPSSHYTPYKTMAELPGMGLLYRAWENKWENATVAHPDRSRLRGGIKHLPLDIQEKIKSTQTVPHHICCADPYWLFRIYQDTHVNQDEITAIIKSGIEESRANQRARNDAKKGFEAFYKMQLDASAFIQRNEIIRGQTKTAHPLDPVLSEYLKFSIPSEFDAYLVTAPKGPLSAPAVGNITCVDSKSRKPGDLWIEWQRPFNHAPVDQYRVFIGNTKAVFMVDAKKMPSNSTLLEGWDGGELNDKGKKMVKLQSRTLTMSVSGFKPGEVVVVFIRPVVNDMRGKSSKVECKV